MKNKIKWLMIILLIPILLGFITSRYGPWWGMREQATTPSTPSNGGKIFVDSSNDLYYLNEAGGTVKLNSGASLSDPSTVGTLTLGSGSITDSSGAISFGDENLTTTGTLDLGADDDTSTLTVHDAGTIVMYDDSDDTSVTVGPVGDGGTILGVTGSLSASGSLYTTSYLYSASDLDTYIDFTAADQILLTAGGGNSSIKIVEGSSTSYIQFGTSVGVLRKKVWRVNIADDGEDSLDVTINESCEGRIISSNSGVVDAWADFILGGDGNVILIANSAGNISANSDTDGDLCLGTAASQNPLTIKNRLGGTRVIHIDILYY